MLFRHTSAAFLITAHTANDNLETVLINMIRGTGLRGLRGIPPKREIIQEKYVIRPWLDIEREDILEYQTTYSIPFRYDSSNAEFEFLRNRIRHTVIPALVNSFPDRNIYDGFRRTVRIISENIEEQIDTALFDLSLTAIPLEDDYIVRERVGIAAEFIESIGPVRRRELLYQIFTIGMGIPDAPHLDSTQMLLVNMFIDTPEKKELLLREDIIFYRQALTRTEYPEIDIIVIEWIRRESISDTMYLLPTTDKPLKTKIGELSSRFVSVKDVHFINGNAYFDAQAIGNRKIFLREWKEGDRIQPFGMNGHSKLVSDLLNEAGVPSYLKTLCLVAVLEDDEELIIWLPGIRAADLAPVTNSTETVLVLERKPLQKQDHDGLNEADDDNVF
jgi:tRNA(Ile)-lysidine synthase